MNRKLSLFLLAITFMLAPLAGAATPEDFKVRTARDLLTLCSVTPDAPDYKEAIHFCHGYLVGALAYHMAMHSGPDGKPLVCVPESGGPTRNEAVMMFVDWLKAHPQYLDEKPVEAEFRFLTEKWPCKR